MAGEPPACLPKGERASRQGQVDVQPLRLLNDDRPWLGAAVESHGEAPLGNTKLP